MKSNTRHTALPLLFPPLDPPICPSPILSVSLPLSSMPLSITFLVYTPETSDFYNRTRFAKLKVPASFPPEHSAAPSWDRVLISSLLPHHTDTAKHNCNEKCLTQTTIMYRIFQKYIQITQLHSKAWWSVTWIDYLSNCRNKLSRTGTCLIGNMNQIKHLFSWIRMLLHTMSQKPSYKQTQAAITTDHIRTLLPPYQSTVRQRELVSPKWWSSAHFSTFWVAPEAESFQWILQYTIMTSKHQHRCSVYKWTYCCLQSVWNLCWAYLGRPC